MRQATDAAAPPALLARYRQVRAASVALAAPLSAEDCQAQSMPDASPVKWHLAHMSWFFETFLLEPHLPGHQPFDPAFRMLFNSYYKGVGDAHARPARGLITRPSLERVLEWRAHVDAGMERLLGSGRAPAALVELGLAHEEQHQELMLTDLKHLLSMNPLLPSYAGRWPLTPVAPVPRDWVEQPGGLVEIGHQGAGFHFDLEGPRHRVWLEPHALASHPVTNGDWIGFIEDGGYRRPELWLADGWDRVEAEGWAAPLYWRAAGSGWRCFTLHGEAPVDVHAPVCHISFYEADAYARWAGARLPTEAEWEAAAGCHAVAGNFAASGAFHPLAPTRGGAGLQQLWGDVWEWTRSAFEPYPGFRPAEGAVGEYNGKFMSGQQVLRGGSCATPAGHVRPTYRNFFPPHARWQFSGLRLARDSGGARQGPVVRTPQMIEEGAPADLAAAVREGLAAAEPWLPAGAFYDALGSTLFEAITKLPEYGLTRAEAGLFAAHADALAAEARARLGTGFQLVDLGAGNCAKAEALFGVLAPSRYVAIDVSGEFLRAALEGVQARHPTLEMVGLVTDFAAGLTLPRELTDRPTLWFWPGSSIGNFEREAAGRLLAGLRVGVPRAALLLGADLVRDEAAMVAAYDDAVGLTAAFNRNILVHANRLVGADFDPARWRHVARFETEGQRMTMALEAIEAQEVRWDGGSRDFAAGARIRTEISTKWTPEGLEHLLAGSGFGPVRLWVDEAAGFALAMG